MTLFHNLFSKAPGDMNELNKPEEERPEDPRNLVPEGSQLVMSFVDSDESPAEDVSAAVHAAFAPEELTLHTEEATAEAAPVEEAPVEEPPAPRSRSEEDDLFLAELRALLNGPLSELDSDHPAAKIAEAAAAETGDIADEAEQTLSRAAEPSGIPEAAAELQAAIDERSELPADHPAAMEEAEEVFGETVSETFKAAEAAEAVEETAAETVEAVEETAAETVEAVEEPAAEAVEAVEETSAEAAEAAEETVAETVEAVEETAAEAAETAEETVAETAEDVKPWPPVDPEQPEEKTENVLEKDTLTRVSYASVAEAALGAHADPEKKTRAPIDDDTLLAELYALIGETPARTPDETPAAPRKKPEQKKAPLKVAPAEEAEEPQTAPALKHAIVEVDRPESQVDLEAEEEMGGAPGWLKGAFLLLLSLLLSGMTFYAIATDLFGKLF